MITSRKRYSGIGSVTKSEKSISRRIYVCLGHNSDTDSYAVLQMENQQSGKHGNLYMMTPYFRDVMYTFRDSSYKRTHRIQQHGVGRGCRR